MKSTNDFRAKSSGFDPDDSIKKAKKLDPIKKNGKEKRSFYNDFDEDEDEDLDSYKKKESILDYFDDEEDER